MRNLSELSVPAITYTDVVPPPPNPLSNDTNETPASDVGIRDSLSRSSTRPLPTDENPTGISAGNLLNSLKPSRTIKN